MPALVAVGVLAGPYTAARIRSAWMCFVLMSPQKHVVRVSAVYSSVSDEIWVWQQWSDILPCCSSYYRETECPVWSFYISQSWSLLRCSVLPPCVWHIFYLFILQSTPERKFSTLQVYSCLFFHIINHWALFYGVQREQTVREGVIFQLFYERTLFMLLAVAS